jgi:hypothetical protein
MQWTVPIQRHRDVLWCARISAPGYTRTLRGVGGEVRLPPENRHQNRDVGISADLVCYTAEQQTSDNA